MKRRKIESDHCKVSQSKISKFFALPHTSTASQSKGTDSITITTKDDQPSTSSQEHHYDAQKHLQKEVNAGKQRKSVANPHWKTIYPWLVIEDHGMFCQICKQFPNTNKNGQTTWVSTPCTRLRKSSLDDHLRSRLHRTNVEREVQTAFAEEHGGIEEAFDVQVAKEHAALVCQMKLVYWLLKEEVAHTTKLNSLVGICQEIGCTELAALHLGENAKYTSQRILQDHVHCISAVIVNEITDKIRQSPWFTILIDESTDVTVSKQLIIYGTFLEKNKQPSTAFLGLLNLPGGTAEIITRVLLKFLLQTLKLDQKRFLGLGSDGASVMVGRVGGVATRLRKQVPWLINNHCVAHRLALAAAQASDHVPYLKQFKSVLQQLFYYYQASPVRMSGLKEIKDILQAPSMKLKEAKDVRWLSHHAAVTALRKTYHSTLVSLSREASERACATGQGLKTFCTKYNFLASVYMLCDVLPHLDRLSKIFQKEDVHLGLIEHEVSATLNSLDELLMVKGPFMSELPRYLEEDKIQEFIRVTQLDQEKFEKNVYKPYLLKLVQNIKNRFPDTQLLAAFQVLDAKQTPPVKDKLFLSYGYDRIEFLCKHFIQHPQLGTVDVAAAKQEWQSLKFHLAEKREALQFHSSCIYVASLTHTHPVMANLAAAALVLPVSTASCERGFSAMKRIKTSLRNRMSDKTLNHCLMVSLEGPPRETFNFDKAAQMWGSMRRRKLLVSGVAASCRAKGWKHRAARRLLNRATFLRKRPRKTLIKN